MSLYSKEEKKTLTELDKKLTDELSSIQDEVLKMFSKEKESNCSIHSLHGTIGGKNNTYADSINSQFNDPNDFKAKWLEGFIEYVGVSKYSPLRTLMKNITFRTYTLTFLERNFYRNLLERTRAKPNESLWTIWFGSGKFIWGLIIAPILRGEIWTNDVSEIRRAQYHYWTIEHVLTTGLIDPDNNEHFIFQDLDDLIKFYKSILKRISNSLYEKEIFDLYINYLENSSNPLLEPFLIPELRYAGLEVQHEYRLDFTILNPHTMEMIGFEFSPHSTHMSVSKLKDKKQFEVNNELSEKWDKEMSKRNKYFQNYKITTITFTDKQLKDIKSCFNIMESYLSKRAPKKIKLEEQISKLKYL